MRLTEYYVPWTSTVGTELAARPTSPRLLANPSSVLEATWSLGDRRPGITQANPRELEAGGAGEETAGQGSERGAGHGVAEVLGRVDWEEGGVSKAMQ
jgi:hypothetical protein